MCDIYSLGAIIFKLLLGRAPTPEISQYIEDHKMHEVSAESNVYEIPYFFKDFIVSNDMCQIIVKMLQKNPQHRFENIYDVKEELLKLKENILQTPVILRQIIGHPILPQEDWGPPKNRVIPNMINFKNSKMNEFSLKYLAKFVFEHRVERLAINGVNGGYMPLHDIKTDGLMELTLCQQGLYSEDLFILS